MLLLDVHALEVEEEWLFASSALSLVYTERLSQWPYVLEEMLQQDTCSFLWMLAVPLEVKWEPTRDNYFREGPY